MTLPQEPPQEKKETFDEAMARVTKEMSDSKTESFIITEIGQEGLDSLIAKYPDWDDFTDEQKKGLSKKSDPLILAMIEDSNTMGFDEFNTEWNLSRHPNFTESQALKMQVLSEKILSREKSEIIDSLKIVTEGDKLKADSLKSLGYLAEADAIESLLNFSLLRFATTKEDSNMVVDISKGVDKLIYGKADLNNIQDLRNFSKKNRVVEQKISDYVNTINISEMESIREELHFIDKDGKESTWSTTGKSELSVRKKIEQILLNTYRRIHDKKIKSNVTVPLGEEEDFDLDRYEID